MAFLYFIFLIVIILIYLGFRNIAIILTLINFVLVIVMFYHHVTTPLQIQL